MLFAFVVSVVAEGANPSTPDAGTLVALMAPVPVAAKLAPEPMRRLALVLVPPVRLVNTVPAVEIALLIDFSVGMLLSEPGVPSEVTTLRPPDKPVPTALLNCGTFPTVVVLGAVSPLPGEPLLPSSVQVFAGAQV
jgi:hypothetical protein